MREVYFYNDGAEIDVGRFLISLGDHQHPVLEDLFVIANAGPSALNCRDMGDGIWEYSRSIANGRHAVLLFALLSESDCYIVLHGFRAGHEGATWEDIRRAQLIRKAYK